MSRTAGLSAAEIDEWNIGTIMDYISIRNDALRRKESDSAYTSDERLKALQKLEPQVDELYRSGRIPEEKYRSFKRQLEQAAKK